MTREGRAPPPHLPPARKARKPRLSGQKRTPRAEPGPAPAQNPNRSRRRHLPLPSSAGARGASSPGRLPRRLQGPPSRQAPPPPSSRRASRAPPPCPAKPLPSSPAIPQATRTPAAQRDLHCSYFALSFSQATSRLASSLRCSWVESLTTTKSARAAFSATGICAASLASACTREYPRVRIMR